MVSFSNVSAFHTSEGLPLPVDAHAHAAGGEAVIGKVVFDALPNTCIHTPTAVIAVASHWLERRSKVTGETTHFTNSVAGECFRVISSTAGGDVIIETRFENSPSSHLFRLLGHPPGYEAAP